MAEPSDAPPPRPRRRPPPRRRRPRARWPSATGSSTWTSRSFAPDPEILQSVPVELMFRYNFLPYRRDGRPARAGDGRPHRHPGGGRAEPAPADGHPARGGHALRDPGGAQARPGHAARAGGGVGVVQDPAPARRRERGRRPLHRQDPGRRLARSSASSTRRSSTPSTAAPPTSTSRPATPRSSSSTASTACCSRP